MSWERRAARETGNERLAVREVRCEKTISETDMPETTSQREGQCEGHIVRKRTYGAKRSIAKI